MKVVRIHIEETWFHVNVDLCCSRRPRTKRARDPVLGYFCPARWRCLSKNPASWNKDLQLLTVSVHVLEAATHWCTSDQLWHHRPQIPHISIGGCARTNTTHTPSGKTSLPQPVLVGCPKCSAGLSDVTPLLHCYTSLLSAQVRKISTLLHRDQLINWAVCCHSA